MNHRNYKIGLVPYQNALPLSFYLDVPYSFGTPAELEKKMEQNELDIALLPAFSFFNHPNYIPLYNAGCISSDGPVESVCLFFKKEIQNPQLIKSINYTSESRTSVNLFKIIYSLYWKKDHKQLIETTKNPDAKLIIGDAALFFEDSNYSKLDLGQIWKDWNNLPFVYAFWVANKPVEESMIEKLNQARVKGMQNIDEIIQKNGDYQKDLLKKYLTKNILFEMTDKAFQGLILFQDYCHKIGLINSKTSVPSF